MAQSVQEANAMFDDAFVVLQHRHRAGVFSVAGSKQPGMHRGTCKAAQQVHVRVKHAKSTVAHGQGSDAKEADDDDTATAGAPV